MKKNWLYNKTVIISGASGGMGFHIAKLLIEKYSCTVIGIARNEAKLLENKKTLGDKQDKFLYRLFDVSIKENWTSFAEWLKENNIKPDVLINNAGFMLAFKKFEDITEKECEEIVNTNFTSYVNATKTLLPLLKESSTPAVINVASSAGLCAMVGQSMYTATKYAVRGFTESLQLDYKGKMYVGGIYPGFVKTNILSRVDDNAKNNKWIDMMMMPVEKASKRIVKAIARKKKKRVLGFDGHYMSFCGRLFPSCTQKTIRKVLKITKLEIFKDIFTD